MLSSEEIFERLFACPHPRMCHQYFQSIPREDLLNVIGLHILSKSALDDNKETDEVIEALPEPARQAYLIQVIDLYAGTDGIEAFLHYRRKDWKQTAEALKAIAGKDHHDLFVSISLEYCRLHPEGRRMLDRGSKIEEVIQTDFDTLWMDPESESESDNACYEFPEHWNEKWYAATDEILELTKDYVIQNEEAFIDSPEELAISDWLGEPKTYFDSTEVHWRCMDLLQSGDRETEVLDRESEIKRLLELAEEYIKSENDREAEVVLLTANGYCSALFDMASNKVYHDLLSLYAELLKNSGRHHSAAAVRHRLALCRGD